MWARRSRALRSVIETVLKNKWNCDLQSHSVVQLSKMGYYERFTGPQFHTTTTGWSAGVLTVRVKIGEDDPFERI